MIEHYGARYLNPRVVGRGHAIGQTTVEDHALILGDPDSGAVVVNGSLDEIARALRDALDRVQTQQSAPAGLCLHCGRDIVLTRGRVAYRHAEDGRVACGDVTGTIHTIAEPLTHCPDCGDPSGPCEETCTDPGCEYPRDCRCHDACEPA